MKYNKEISIKKSYELVVCGGGMSGFSGAVAAARKGVKTAIVERFGCLGGVATVAGVNHFLAGRKLNSVTGKMERKVGGLFDELTDELIFSGGAVDPDTIDLNFNPHGWYPRMAAGIPFDAEKLKVLLDDYCLRENIDIYYFTSILDVQDENEIITNIIVSNKSGIFALKARLFIDATGDADIAYMSGCRTLKGRSEDGLMTPATLEMHVENVDTRALVTYQNENKSPKLTKIIIALKEKGIWDFPFDIFVADQLCHEGIFMINTIRQVGIDGTDGDSVTRGMIDGRRDNFRLFEIMKEYFPGFKNARIKKIAEMIGIRETRRIVGYYTVTLADAESGKMFNDCVAATTYNFDLPDPLKPSLDPMMGHGENPNADREHECIEIPYRSLLPKEKRNLIVAGRSVSVEREVLGPVRIMGPCMFMGQAAGLASFLALENADYSLVDTTILRNLLREDGCLLPD